MKSLKLKSSELVTVLTKDKKELKSIIDLYNMCVKAQGAR